MLIVVKFISLVLMGLFYIYAGLRHFTHTQFYLDIMPPYLPAHLELVYISGVAEIVLGAALFVPRFRRWAAWGIIALLIAVFPANVHTAMNPELYDFAPVWGHYVRLPFQVIFILWAYWYTRPHVPTIGKAGAEPEPTTA